MQNLSPEQAIERLKLAIGTARAMARQLGQEALTLELTRAEHAALLWGIQTEARARRAKRQRHEKPPLNEFVLHLLRAHLRQLVRGEIEANRDVPPAVAAFITREKDEG